MTTPADYRKFAVEYLEEAERTQDAELRKTFLELARKMEAAMLVAENKLPTVMKDEVSGASD